MRQQVIIVTYNQCELLKKCLDSILNNEFRPELITVIDDASTDDTRDLLSDYKTEFGEIIQLHFNKINLGVFENINFARTFACLDIIHLIGGDDYFNPNFFKEVDGAVSNFRENLENKNFMVATSFYYEENNKLRLEKKSKFKDNYCYSFNDVVFDRIRHRNLGLSLEYFKKMPTSPFKDYPWFDLYCYYQHAMGLEYVVPCSQASSVYKLGVGITSKLPKSFIWASKTLALMKFFLDFFDQVSMKIKIKLLFDALISIAISIIHLFREKVISRIGRP